VNFPSLCAAAALPALPLDRSSSSVFPLLILGGGIGAVLVLALLLRTLFGAGRRFPYERCDALFTPAERAFFNALRRAVGSEFLIFGKIRLADIIQPRRPLSRQRYFQALGRVTSKHIDFVLCDPRTLEIVVAIELDDRTHQTQPRRRERDVFVDGSLAAAGVPLLRVPVQRSYEVSALSAQLAGFRGSASRRTSTV
jgi:hypothetical protein